MTGSATHTRNYSTSSATMNPSTLHIDGSAAVNEENLFGSLTGFDDLANDDNDEDLSLDDGGDDDTFATGDGEDVKPAVKGKKGKLPPSTAEKKATHNAVERARRESLNARFLVLADMLPGMNHVKRASKAAIVNKSIDLIRTLRSVESKLAKENEALKEELNAIRQSRLSGTGVLPTPAGPSVAQAGGNTGAQSSPGGTLPQMFGLPAMHPATAAATAAAAAAGFPVLPGMGALPPHMQHQIHLAAAHQQAHAHAQAQAMVQHQQQQMAEHHQRSASVSSSPAGGNGIPAPLPVFPGVFNGLLGGPQQQNHNNGSNAGNFLGSPADFGDFLGGAGIRNGSNSPDSSSNHANNNNTNANAAAAAAYFEFLNASAAAANTASSNRGDSPVSYNSPKDSASTSSNNAGSNNGAGTAPSPASSQSHSISTPVSNSYSPLPHTATFGGFGNNGTGAGNGPVDGTSPPNPAIVAFDVSSDPLFLAANFSNADIVKAQNDLSAFIAYQQQQTMNGGHNNGPNTPTTPSFQTNPFASAFTGGFAGHQTPHGAPSAGHPQGPQFSTTQHVPNIPAWQLMMAQQQAVTAAYGQSY